MMEVYFTPLFSSMICGGQGWERLGIKQMELSLAGISSEIWLKLYG